MSVNMEILMLKGWMEEPLRLAEGEFFFFPAFDFGVR